jgi:hypothetical protein
MKYTLPLMYEDHETRVISDRHGTTIIDVAENVEFENDFLADRRLVRVTLPPGRSWFMMPADLLSRKVGGELK